MKECTANIKYYGKPFKLVTSAKCQQDNTRCLYKCVMENIFFSALTSGGYKNKMESLSYLTLCVSSKFFSTAKDKYIRP